MPNIRRLSSGVVATTQQGLKMTPREAMTIVKSDSYHSAIRYAAKALLETKEINRKYGGRCRDYAEFVYVTQYASGATVWKSADESVSVMVTSNGNVSDEVHVAPAEPCR